MSSRDADINSFELSGSALNRSLMAEVSILMLIDSTIFAKHNIQDFSNANVSFSAFKTSASDDEDRERNIRGRLLTKKSSRFLKVSGSFMALSLQSVAM